MGNKSGKVQRANKQELIEARRVLKELWSRAYTEGEVVITYSTNVSGKQKALSLFNSLADYRTQIKKKQLEEYEIFVMIAACSLHKLEYGLKIKRKEAKFSDRSTIILDLINDRPDLKLTKNENENSLTNIIKGFKDES